MPRIELTQNTTFYVKYNGGDDNDDGLSWDTAKKTMSAMDQMLHDDYHIRGHSVLVRVHRCTNGVDNIFMYGPLMGQRSAWDYAYVGEEEEDTTRTFDLGQSIWMSPNSNPCLAMYGGARAFFKGLLFGPADGVEVSTVILAEDGANLYLMQMGLGGTGPKGAGSQIQASRGGKIGLFSLIDFRGSVQDGNLFHVITSGSHIEVMSTIRIKFTGIQARSFIEMAQNSSAVFPAEYVTWIDRDDAMITNKAFLTMNATLETSTADEPQKWNAFLPGTRNAVAVKGAQIGN